MMKRNNVIKIMLWVAIISGVVGILGQYDLVVIKFISKYDFELLLVGFALLLVLRLFKK